MKSLNINVMLGLLSVLFISLGYLSMQGKQGFRSKREGFREGLTDAEKKTAEEKEKAAADKKATAIADAKTQKRCEEAEGKWNHLASKCE